MRAARRKQKKSKPGNVSMAPSRCIAHYTLLLYTRIQKRERKLDIQRSPQKGDTRRTLDYYLHDRDATAPRRTRVVQRLLWRESRRMTFFRRFLSPDFSRYNYIYILYTYPFTRIVGQ